MAEIRVERKRGTPAWIWVVLVLVVLAAIAVYLWQTGALNSDAISELTDRTLITEGGRYGQT